MVDKPLALGRIGGHPLVMTRRGRDIVIGWGDIVMEASNAAAANPEHSVAGLCTGWLRAGKRPPQRVGAVWPARCWPVSRDLDTTAPPWRVLAQGPPAVWWGWTESHKAVDSVKYAGLRVFVHDFLDTLPLDVSPLP